MNVVATIDLMINPWTEVTFEPGTQGAKSGLRYSLDLKPEEFEFDWES
jgi:hypothetical protein